MDDGYVKLYRSALRKGWLQNPKLWAFWCWCLMKASYQDHDLIVGHQIIKLSPGQFVFGRKNAAKELRQSEQSIRTHLDFCINLDKNLTIQSTNKFSIITIVNWDSYQSVENLINHQNNQPTTSQQPATNQLLTTNKKGNNGKKGKKETILTGWPDDFILTDHLRELAKPYIPSDKIELEWEAFKAYSISKGKKYSDWNHAWTTRYINYSKYNTPTNEEDSDKEQREKYLRDKYGQT